MEVKETVKPAYALLLAALLASPAFLPFPAAGDAGAGPYPLRVRTEWDSGAFNGTTYALMHDLDGDHRRELLVWGDLRDGEGTLSASVMVYRPPSYALACTASFPSDGTALSLVDLHQNGSVQLLLERSGPDWTNFTVLSGSDLSITWQGPDLGGRPASTPLQNITDVDQDGELEFIWVNTTSSFDPNFTEVFESRIQIYGAEGHERKWVSLAIAQQVLEFRAVQLDGDAALELFMIGAEIDESSNPFRQSARVYDGASHALQWATPADDDLTGLSSIFLGDADNDTRGEVVLRADNGTSSGVRMYSGGNGAPLWNRTLGNTTVMARAADIDSDGAQELVATGSAGADPQNHTSELTHYVFDLGSRSLAWTAGPFVASNNITSSLAPLFTIGGTLPDIVPGTLPGLVLSNTTVTGPASSLVTYEVIDGKTLASKWRSPAFASFGTNYTAGLTATQADSDSALELVVPEVWLSAKPQFTGRVRLFSADDFTEEWASPVYPGIVGALGYDAVNDSRPELLLVSTDIDFTSFPLTFPYQMRIFNGDTHALLWTGPKSAREDFEFTDLYGSTMREIAYCTIDDKAGTTVSALMVYNDTTLSEAWTTGQSKGSISIVFSGDADNDTLGELVTSRQWEDAAFDRFTNVTVFELSERAPPLPDLALARADIAISDQTPVAGMPLTLKATVRNFGPVNASGCCVTFFVDGAPAGQRTVDVAGGNSSELEFCWTAAAGDHALTVALDPQDLIEESNETNNNATLPVSVGARPRPEPVISSPGEGELFASGTNITFNGTASVFPPGGTRSFRWTSDSSGYIGNASLLDATLPQGPHRITLLADDGFGNASATVNISVGPPKPPPGVTWAAIASPGSGSVFYAGEPIFFDANGSVPARPEYVLSCNWSSNRTGPLGSVARFRRAIPAGRHNITLTVDDGHGGRASAWADIDVNGSAGVVAYISSPVEGQTSDADQEMLFDGSKSTGPPGSVLAFEWSSNLSGSLGTGSTFSKRLPAGRHSIILKVSDGQGHAAAASVNISVTGAVDIPPSVSIAYPSERATVRGVVNLTGTAADEVKVLAVWVRIDDGPWERASGAENWSHAWNTSGVPNGTHQITVRASDGRLNSSDATVNVTVDNPGRRPRQPGPGAEQFPVALATLVVLVVIIAAASAAYLFLRRRRGGPLPPVEGTESRGPSPPRM